MTKEYHIVKSLDFAVRAFKCFERNHEQLWWFIREGQLCLAANETTYVWIQRHDTEMVDITEENIDLLERCKRELDATGRWDTEEWLAALFISRVKKDKPRQEFFDKMSPAVLALFHSL